MGNHIGRVPRRNRARRHENAIQQTIDQVHEDHAAAAQTMPSDDSQASVLSNLWNAQLHQTRVQQLERGCMPFVKIDLIGILAALYNINSSDPRQLHLQSLSVNDLRVLIRIKVFGGRAESTGLESLELGLVNAIE